MSKAVSGVDEVRARAWVDRPSPAIPLLLLALVVSGALVVGLVRAAQVTVVPDASQPEFGLVSGPMPMDDRVRLWYWVVASIAAYLLALCIARRQGYRSGLWVNRRPLVVAGVLALLAALIIVLGWFAPGDLLIRGNVPLLAIAVGIVVWALRERRPGLWVVAAVIVPVTLLANLYDVDNLPLRLGISVLDDADQIADLGAVAVVLFIASAVFGVLRWRAARPTHARRAQ